MGGEEEDEENVEQLMDDLESTKQLLELEVRSKKLLEKDSDLIARTKLLTKVIYDVSKLLEPSPCHRTLPELIVDGFDCEQVHFHHETLDPIQNFNRSGPVLSFKTRLV